MVDNLEEQYYTPPYKNTRNYLDSQYALPGGIQVVPVHTTADSVDYVLAPWNFCPGIYDMIDAFAAMPE